MKFLRKVLERWQSRKNEGKNIASNGIIGKQINSKLYGSDDDLGFC